VRDGPPRRSRGGPSSRFHFHFYFLFFIAAVAALGSGTRPAGDRLPLAGRRGGVGDARRRLQAWGALRLPSFSCLGDGIPASTCELGALPGAKSISGEGSYSHR